MRVTIQKIAFIAVCSLFALASCDPERNKASLHDSADTLHTDNAKHKYEDGTMQRDTNAAGAKKDSATNDGNADPSGRMQKQ